MFVSTLKQFYTCQNTFTFATSIQDIPESILGHLKHRVLFYLDGFDLARSALGDLLVSAQQAIQAPHQYALFNLEEDTGIVRTALNYGARGIFFRDAALSDFCKGTRCILNCEVWLSRSVMINLIEEGTPITSSLPTDDTQVPTLLSPREREVVTLLATGATNNEIANTLFISSHTVRTHLHNIYKKINVKCRSQAALWAVKNLLD